MDKFNYMTISGTSNRQYSVYTDYICIIQHCKEESDVGVTFTTIIYHTFHMIILHTLYLLYISLARPHLDNVCVVWQPHLLKDIRALKQGYYYLPNLTHLTYSDTLIKVIKSALTIL